MQRHIFHTQSVCLRLADKIGIVDVGTEILQGLGQLEAGGAQTENANLLAI